MRFLLDLVTAASVTFLVPLGLFNVLPERLVPQGVLLLSRHSSPASTAGGGRRDGCVRFPHRTRFRHRGFLLILIVREEHHLLLLAGLREESCQLLVVFLELLKLEQLGR